MILKSRKKLKCNKLINLKKTKIYKKLNNNKKKKT